MNTNIKAIETAVVSTSAVAETKTAKRQAKTWHFKDGDYAIPAKIKCAKCGRDVAGYAPLVYERVMTKFNGEWNRYLKEFTCGDCKREEKGVILEKINFERNKEKLAKAKELLEKNGMAVVNTINTASTAVVKR